MSAKIGKAVSQSLPLPPTIYMINWQLGLAITLVSPIFFPLLSEECGIAGAVRHTLSPGPVCFKVVGCPLLQAPAEACVIGYSTWMGLGWSDRHVPVGWLSGRDGMSDRPVRPVSL